MKTSKLDTNSHARVTGPVARLFLHILLGLAAVPALADEIIQVGGKSPIRTIAEAATLARDGDTVVIAPGDYYGDVAVWKQDRLTILAGAGGRVRLIAAGSHAQGEGHLGGRRRQDHGGRHRLLRRPRAGP